MEKQTNITRGQLFSALVTISIAILTSWMSMNQRVKALEVGTEIRLKQLESQVEKNEGHYLNILDAINELEVSLQNKQNRE